MTHYCCCCSWLFKQEIQFDCESFSFFFYYFCLLNFKNYGEIHWMAINWIYWNGQSANWSFLQLCQTGFDGVTNAHAHRHTECVCCKIYKLRRLKREKSPITSEWNWCCLQALYTCACVLRIHLCDLRLKSFNTC